MVAPVGSRTLEVKIQSAEDLCVDRKPVTKNVYVEVRAESINFSSTGMATAEGRNPSWNETLMVDIPAHAKSITFEVKCKTSMGSKSIGVARIALSDFLGGIVPENCLQYLSYRLRDWDGRRNGIVNFSVRMKTVSALEYKPWVPMPARGTAVAEKSSCGFQMRTPLGDQQKNSHGVVTGVPVYWNNHASHI